jgi:hypothetical protein
MIIGSTHDHRQALPLRRAILAALASDPPPPLELMGPDQLPAKVKVTAAILRRQKNSTSVTLTVSSTLRERVDVTFSHGSS